MTGRGEKEEKMARGAIILSISVKGRRLIENLLYCLAKQVLVFLRIKEGNFCQEVLSLRSKLFRLVLEQRKTEEWDFTIWPRESWNESQKIKEREGEGMKPTPFLSSPLPPPPPRPTGLYSYKFL